MRASEKSVNFLSLFSHQERKEAAASLLCDGILGKLGSISLLTLCSGFRLKNREKGLSGDGDARGRARGL